MFDEPESFEIELEASNGIFQPGGIVSGRVRLVNQTFIHQLLGIRVDCRGGANVHWTEQVKEGSGEVNIYARAVARNIITQLTLRIFNLASVFMVIQENSLIKLEMNTARNGELLYYLNHQVAIVFVLLNLLLSLNVIFYI
jgi:hypothetical protein